MRIAISVGGKHHAFRLAEQLDKRGLLDKIITNYPLFKLKNPGVRRDKIVSIPFPRAIQYVFVKTGVSWVNNIGSYINRNIFDALASKKVSSCDIFQGWSGFSIRTIKKAHSIGMKTVVEQSCPHILEQIKILKKEYQNLGLNMNVDWSFVNQRLKEYEMVDYISVSSTFTRDTCIKQGIPEEKILLATLSGNIDLKKTKKEDDIFRVSFVGGNVIRKGLIYLMRAWESLDMKNSELAVRTNFLGKQGEKSIFSNFFRNPTIKLLSFIPNLSQFYSNSSVFCLPSVEEGFGMVILEAMACGTPVIINENVGAKDIVRDEKDGLIVKPRDSNAIKEAITYFYDNPNEIKRMGNNARKRAKKYSWDNYGETMIKHYKKILE